MRNGRFLAFVAVGALLGSGVTSGCGGDGGSNSSPPATGGSSGAAHVGGRAGSSASTGGSDSGGATSQAGSGGEVLGGAGGSPPAGNGGQTAGGVAGAPGPLGAAGEAGGSSNAAGALVVGGAGGGGKAVPGRAGGDGGALSAGAGGEAGNGTSGAAGSAGQPVDACTIDDDVDDDGHVALACGGDDCDDDAGDVNPDVTDYFDEQASNGTWDYDCSSSIEKQVEFAVDGREFATPYECVLAVPDVTTCIRAFGPPGVAHCIGTTYIVGAVGHWGREPFAICGCGVSYDVSACIVNNAGDGCFRVTIPAGIAGAGPQVTCR